MSGFGIFIIYIHITINQHLEKRKTVMFPTIDSAKGFLVSRFLNLIM